MKYGERLLRALEYFEKTSHGAVDFLNQHGLWRSGVRQNTYQQLYLLRKDGLVAEKRGDMRLTRRGEAKLETLRKRLEKMLPAPPRYPSALSDEIIIISFDIPERERRKRAWLRAVLTNMEFKLYHKSLWVARIKIPAEFIEDLVRYRLAGYVAIFAVTRHGTLKKIV